MISHSMFITEMFRFFPIRINGKNKKKTHEWALDLFISSALGQTDLARISVKGARTAYEKYKDTCESKGIKAHFQLDDNCLLVLDRVNHERNICQREIEAFLMSCRWNFSSNETKQQLIEILPMKMMIHPHYQVNSLFFLRSYSSFSSSNRIT